MTRRTVAIIGLTLAAFTATSAHAQFAKPDDAVKYRKAVMHVIAAHFGRLVAVARGSAPNDSAQVKANAQVLQALAGVSWSAYGPGLQGGDADAKPEIWSDAAGFAQKQQDFESKVAVLTAAADAGDLAKLKDAVGAVGASCKACHDAYRSGH